MVASKSLIGMVCVSITLAGATAGAAAQVVERLFPFLAPPPTAPAVADPGPNSRSSGAAEWSGQSGASGHPLMTAEAIVAAAANFNACLQGLWPDAARRGVARETFDVHTRDLTPDLRIMD